MDVKVLDCTIRDGGHLNKWKFQPQVVKASYYAAVKSGVDYFEVGYRYPTSINGLGLFGYCGDDFLLTLIKPSDKCKLSVMIDVGKCDSNLFSQCNPEITPVRLVRVASYPYEVEKAIRLVQELKDKGYEVILNLMATSEWTEEQYDCLRRWDNKHILNAVYFADSFGSFVPADVPQYITKLKEVGFERVGFHPHNNLQLAFANTLAAIQAGADYVDASIFGMGRGAGNLPIEVLTGYLERIGDVKYNTVPYLEVIDRYYLELFSQLKWGYKIPSLLSGLKNVHPYYVDEIFDKHTYTVDEVWNALDIIKEQCPISFSVSKLNEALEKRFYTPLTKEKVEHVCSALYDQIKILPAADAFRAGNFELTNRHSGRKFLIIANGPSIVKYKDKIQQLIEKENCITIGVNYLKGIFIPDYHAFVSRKRFLKYAEFINKESELLVPSFFGREIVEHNFQGKRKYFDINSTDDLNIEPVKGSAQNLVNLNVAVSAILLAYQMGASEIYAVGMDGYIDENNKQMVYFYDENDRPDDKDVASIRYEMLAEELRRVNAFLQEESVPFSIVTPTSHKSYFTNLLDL